MAELASDFVAELPRSSHSAVMGMAIFSFEKRSRDIGHTAIITPSFCGNWPDFGHTGVIAVRRQWPFLMRHGDNLTYG